MSGEERSDKLTVRTDDDTLDLGSPKSMSNTVLLSEIDELLSSGEAMDTDKIEQYLALLQERAPVMEDYDPAVQWDKLKDEHPLLFEEDAVNTSEAGPEVKYSPKPKRSKLVRLLHVAEIAVAALLCIIVAANAFGFNPIQAFFKWADGVIQIYNNPSGVMELPAEDPSQYHSLEEALAADGINSGACPSWVPKDYSVAAISVKRTTEFIKYSSIFESERGEILIRVMQFTPSEWSTVEERETGGYLYSHNGIEYYILSNYDITKAGWNIGEFSYLISGQLSENELKQMIDSIS
ncbi:hypothetical protein KL86CLO1_10739 [uncultured Eubacteriales bacterium]|uniref:DUF4367 domain-containing protein n=1 Tax=uncultured Eubacteriales bacterium TaxID=172733 RepID=A0A212JAB1_9FIRM|nr:hypothetical protein KL86CLO1_10739 [uncultured Eubacteriales bacterium]